MKAMMTIHYTCFSCHSGNEIYPQLGEVKDLCHICQHEQLLKFNQQHLDGILQECPVCQRKDFYQQKDRQVELTGW